jgi:DNA helicase II / ATP-dependent DNA helicase PcrA
MSRSNHTPEAPYAINPRFNAAQRAAVESQAETTIVIAGPGSGKTEVLCERVRSRVAAGTNPDRMAVMTFTNAGADEFTRRLAPIVPGYVGTVHGFCLRLLRQWGHLIGYRKGGMSINVLSDDAVTGMLEAARDALGMKKKLTMKAIRDHANGVQNVQAALVWSAYRDQLKRNNMIDYDRILTEASKLLDLDAVASSLKIDELMTDETQDSGMVDWTIYLKLRAKKLFVVGDPDQSIYAFRGGMPSLLTDFAMSTNPKCATFWLETNYRSTREICEAASTLIAHNTNRIPKATKPFTSMTGNVITAAFATDVDEAEYAAVRLREHHRLGATDWIDMAVLCRTNVIATKVRQILLANAVPVAKPAALAKPPEWGRVLMAVGLAADPANDVYAERLLAARKWPESVESAKRSAAILRQPLALHAGLQPPTAICDIPRFLSEQGIPRESIGVVEAQIEAIGRPTTLLEFLQTLVSLDEFGDARQGATLGVEVSTVHGAKGSEWSVVFVVGCEEGTFPSGKADQEEERRLMFVAMTRAKRHLTLTWARKRLNIEHFLTRDNLEPSRFLSEI